jgi:hypothetical protein
MRGAQGNRAERVMGEECANMQMIVTTSDAKYGNVRSVLNQDNIVRNPDVVFNNDLIQRACAIEILAADI